jgi:hypothetical protein
MQENTICFAAFHGMKYIDDIIRKDIVDNFKRIAIVVQPNEEIFMFLSGHSMIKQTLFNGFSNVRFTYSMLERRLAEPDVNVHV